MEVTNTAASKLMTTEPPPLKKARLPVTIAYLTVFANAAVLRDRRALTHILSLVLVCSDWRMVVVDVVVL